MSTERMREMIRAGIIGSTGYAGQELVRILLGHKDVEIKLHRSGICECISEYVPACAGHLQGRRFRTAL